MALSALALCARALLKLGAQPIAAFDEGTAEAEVAAALYPGLRDALLSLHPWSFATGESTLPRLSALPLADFRHAFQLPANFLRALSAGHTGRSRGVEYRILEGRLHCDAEHLTLRHIFRPEESSFPAFFASALVDRMAAEFCLPLTENDQRAALLAEAAETSLRAARLADSQQATPMRLEGFPLLATRHGTGF